MRCSTGWAEAVASRRFANPCSVVCAALLALACSNAQAHEFWVMPARFAVDPMQRVAIELRVGAGWPGESVPRKPERIERFAWIDVRGEQPIAGERAADPAGSAIARATGFAIAIYRSNAASITLAGDRFEAYLRDEGLDAIMALRAKSGASSKAATEHYSRCAKALVRVGDGGASHVGFDRSAGLQLELIPLVDPSRLRPGESLTLQLLLEGKPLAGALLNVFAKDGPRSPITARTDANGRATIRWTKPGVWLISTVHMVRARPESGADWNSVWSSLTLEIPDESGRRQGDS